MLKYWKRGAAVLLALVLMLALALTVSAKETEPETAEEPAAAEPRVTGKIFHEIPGSTALTDAYLAGRSVSTNDNDSLPAYYDSRTLGCITAVRNQNPYGTCWAHGALGSVEAYMIKHGVTDAVTGSPATLSINESEYHLAWFAYTYAYDKLGMLTGDKSTPNYYNYDYLDLGGNGEIATYTVMRWEGPASETVSALQYGNANHNSSLSSTYAYRYDNAHVQNVDWIPTANMEAVKRAIMEYGAGTFGYCHEDAYCNSSTGAYCYIQSVPYGSDYFDYSNHDVTVVGWDDNYSRNNFNAVSRPQHDGAWIIKNSWGAYYGDNGYIYISYEDSASLNDYCYFYQVEPTDNYDSIYQYDGTTNFSDYAEMTPGSSIANAFVANGSELLKAVALCTWDEDVDYTLQIYTDFTGSNPTNGTLAAEKSGNLPYMGYHTIELELPVLLSAGQKYAVVFTLTAEELNVPYDVSASGSWIAWTHVNHANCSFYRNAGGSWNAAPAARSYRIKAYTSEIPAPVYDIQAVSNDESMGTVTVVGTQILAQPAEGCYLEDARVLEGEAELTVSGNTITVNAQSDCTVEAIFAHRPEVTVTFTCAGEVCGSVTTWADELLTLPELPQVEGFSPVGWTLVTVSEDASEPPRYYRAGDSYATSHDVTLNALYSHLGAGTGAGGDYLWVSEQIRLTDGVYLIVYEDGSLIFDGSRSTLDVGQNGLAVTIADGRIPRSDRIDAASFTVAVEEGTVQSASGCYIGRASSTRNGLDTSTSPLTNRISIAADGSAVIRGEGGLCLRYNAQSGTTGERFRYYKAGAQNPIRLYRRDGSPGDPLYTTMPREHVHSPKYVDELAPTCTEPGEAAYWYCTDPSCPLRGRRFVDEALTQELTERTLPALGHDYVAGAVTEPTCTEGGFTVYVCSRCEDKIERDETEPLGHAWDEGVVTEEPTCDGAGKALYTCTRCGEKRSETVPALGHDLVVTVVEPTCVDQGYTSHNCTRCRYGYCDNEVPALGHDYQAAVTEPTCTEGGFTVHTCSRCGDEYKSDGTDPLGHDWQTQIIEPTCTEGGFTVHTCSRCGDEYKSDETDPLDHDWRGGVTVEPTCDTDGTAVYSCERCGKKRTDTLPALGHDLQEELHAPTCTDSGWTHHFCTRCKYGYNDSEVPALGHDWGDWTLKEAPTCVAAGEETRVCARCQESEGREIEALGHDYQAVITEPTCTEGGFTVYTCARCEDSYTADETEALGHDYQAEVTEPTCTEGGFTTYTCARCEDSYTADETEALGHSFGAWQENKPTPENPLIPAYVGHHRECERCGLGEIGSHLNWSEGVVTTAPSCTEEGVMTYTCVDCGALRREAIEALGHDYQAEVTEPTCTEGGCTTYTCSRCEDFYTADETEALGHSFGAWQENRPTTEQPDAPAYDGHYRICARCGRNEIGAHEWNEGAVTTPPSCTAQGVKTLTCELCAATVTETIEALGHDYQAEVTEPTCTEGGYTTYTCTRCEDSYTADETEALGHDYVNGVCTRCGAEAPDVQPPFRFDDVQNEKSYYFDAVYWAYEHDPQITKGVTDTLFAPEDPCTRAQVVTFLWRAAGEPAPESGNNPFTDVEEGKFFYNAVLWAVEKGITNGVTKTAFEPNDTCTRGQIVTFLWRFAGMPEPVGADIPGAAGIPPANDGKLSDARGTNPLRGISSPTANNPFTDVAEGKFYYNAVLWAVENEITTGMTPTAFAPDATCTRAQVVTFLYRATAE